MPEWVIWLAGLLTPGIGALWLFFTKVWFPEAARRREHEREMAEQAETARRAEEAREHEHQREQAEARNAADQAEQIAVWSQMTQLQSQALRQNELLLEYMVTDYRDGQEKIREEVRRLVYDSRGVQAKISLLITIITEMYDKRQKERNAEFERDYQG